jgi:hypothetical protein
VAFNVRVNVQNLIVKYCDNGSQITFYCGSLSMNSARPDNWKEEFIVGEGNDGGGE